MTSLPACRWRREPLGPDRHACVSSLITTPAHGVSAEQCRTCIVRDHAPRPAGPGPCIHLGARVGMADCPPCAAAAGRPVQVPAHVCALHARCTIAAPLPGLYCCATCPDRVTAPPRADAGAVRHLTYFVCPLGQGWRPNLARLRQRMSIFNGRRMVFVAQGPGLAPFDLVRQELEGCDVIWMTGENSVQLKEYIGFPHLLRSMSEYRSEADVTFYGHAKGVSSAAWGPGVERWADSMYSGLLDYWPAVQRELATACCVGLWRKRQGWRPANTSDWHYAGSFRWVRNRDMYSRDWDNYLMDWVCPEAHVGGVFRLAESACLYGDCGSAQTQLYGSDAWDMWATAERRQWEERHRADRLTPLLATVIVTSHCQPELVHDAIASVRAQTTDGWQCLIVDSGPLAAAGAFARYAADARIGLEVVGQDGDGSGDTCHHSRKINEAWRRGRVRGDLVCHLSDDDVLDPGWIAAATAAARDHPEQSAWYGPADLADIYVGGRVGLGGRLHTHGVGRPGNELLGRVDGMQVIHRRSACTDWSEALDGCGTNDGEWMDRLAAAHPIHPLPATAGTHRHTPLSTFTRSRE